MWLLGMVKCDFFFFFKDYNMKSFMKWLSYFFIEYLFIFFKVNVNVGCFGGFVGSKYFLVVCDLCY